MMRCLSHLSIAVAALLLLGAAPAPVKENPAERGYRLARDASERDRGYRDYTANGRMILRAGGGGTSERAFEFMALDEGSVTKSLLVFKWPGDIRDTALLTHAEEGRDDNQWVFLPVEGRAKRISGSGSSGSFVGSEFAYEDLVNQDVDKFTYLWIEDSPCPGAESVTCHVVDRMPKYSSGYSRQRVWFDSKELRLVMVRYFDRRGAHIKTLTASAYKLIDGRYWRAEQMLMENLVTRKSTALNWGDFRFGVGLQDSQFSVGALRTNP